MVNARVGRWLQICFKFNSRNIACMWKNQAQILLSKRSPVNRANNMTNLEWSSSWRSKMFIYLCLHFHLAFFIISVLVILFSFISFSSDIYLKHLFIFTHLKQCNGFKLNNKLLIENCSFSNNTTDCLFFNDVHYFDKSIQNGSKMVVSLPQTKH